MNFINPMIDIFLISIVLVIFSKVLQRKFIDKDAMKKQQQEMKIKQKRIKELIEQKDDKSMQEANKIQQEMFEAMGKTMQGTMKHMMFSLPVFLGVFALIRMFYGEATIDLPIPIPWLGETGIELFEQTNWFGWYFLSYLVLNIIIGIAEKLVKKSRREQK